MRVLFYWLAATLLVAALLFAPAGRFDLPLFWAYIGVSSLLLLAAFIGMDPGLRRERFKPGPGGRDYLLPAVGRILVFVHWMLAGYQMGHLHGESPFPMSIRIGALVGFLLFLGLAVWSLVVNPFFSPLIRLQDDRGHRLIRTGPYGWVRHPGYLGATLGFICSGLALGSTWALIPAGIILPLLIRRLIMEDRFLRDQLEGYEQYTESVRWRLIPGIW